MARPSGLSSRLLALMLGRADARAALDELDELYQIRRRRDGERAAAAWLRRQLLQYPFRLLDDRIRGVLHERRARRRSPRAERVRDAIREARLGIRSLARTPALSATIVLTVGLGVGATTAVFALVDAVMLRALPYPGADRLVRIYTDSPPNRWPFSVADYLTLKRQQTTLEQVAGYANASMTFSRDAVAERVSGRVVTWSYFSLLGARPLHGRLFVAADEHPGSDPSVVVSHAFWRRHLDADVAALGGPLRLDGVPHTLIGVLPPDPGPLERGRAFFAAARWPDPPRKGPFFITALGRLRAGADRSAVEAELRAINRRMFPVWQASYQDERASWGVMDLRPFVIGDVGRTLVLILGAAVFLLLIACTNAANLLLARIAHRRRELAVRSALGASRARLLLHLLSESGLLALGAALVGLLLSLGATQAISAAAADAIPRARELRLDARAVGVLAALTLGSGLLFGLVPSLHGLRPRLGDTLRAGSRTATGASPRRLRRALVAGQFAVSTPLLIAAGLLVASLARLQAVDPGYDREGVVSAALMLPAQQYPEAGAVATFWDRMESRVAALPGVEALAFADGRPPNDVENFDNFELEDRPTPPGGSQPVVPWIAVTPEYFELMGITLLRGRLLDEHDRDRVVVVDRAWARRFFPGTEAVGRRFRSGGCSDCPWTEVVGVVSPVKYAGLDRPDEGTVYWPLAARPAEFPIDRVSQRFRFLLVRSSAEPEATAASLRRAVGELDPALALTGVATLEDLVARSYERPRNLLALVFVFAATALLLSLVGIYGVMSYFVQQHTRDIGIRIALGGGRTRVASAIVGQGLAIVAAGLGAGTVASLWLGRFLSSALFEVSATDPATFATVPAAMLGAAGLACLLPARRAAALDPAITLREE